MLVPQKVNGFVVEAAIRLPERRGFVPGFAVVCDRGDDYVDRWVVWEVVEYGFDRTAYYGFYTGDRGLALKDMLKRAGVNG